jgi:hypothetical protein
MTVPGIVPIISSGTGGCHRHGGCLLQGRRFRCLAWPCAQAGGVVPRSSASPFDPQQTTTARRTCGEPSACNFFPFMQLNGRNLRNMRTGSTLSYFRHTRSPPPVPRDSNTSTPGDASGYGDQRREDGRRGSVSDPRATP